jgi:hypothetical protein
MSRKPAPKKPIFLSWGRLLWKLKDKFANASTEQELEEEVKRLFLMGAPQDGYEGSLDFEGVRSMVHSLDPYVVGAQSWSQ